MALFLVVNWRMEVSTELVSPNSILRKLRLHACLNVRKLAALHGVDATSEALAAAVADLKRRGRIRSTGCRGRHAAFVLATFDL